MGIHAEDAGYEENNEENVINEDFFLNGNMEYEEIDGNEIITPFDPTQIKVATSQLTIDLILKRIEQGDLNLTPNFQRKSGLWSPQAQSRLLESLLIRIPIPAFYFDSSNEDKWLVIDGLQRLTALTRFVIEKSLKLQGMEFLTHLNEQGFDDLSTRYRRRILETQVIVYQIEQGTPPNVKFNIFKRINTGGLPLSPQEIRHALHEGPVTEFLLKLTQTKEFLEATDHSVKDDRMAARELALRFLAFTLTPYTQYEGDLDIFLNHAMEHLNEIESTYPELENRFITAMQRAVALFGKDAFRKRYKPEDSQIRKRFRTEDTRFPINKALFETWAVNLSQLSENDFEKLISHRKELMDLFVDIMGAGYFNEAISQGTGDKNKVYRRFKQIEQIIKDALK